MNNKMKRGISMALVLALAAGMSAGCSKKAQDTDAEGRTLITVGGYPVKEGTSKDSFDRKIASFEEANPDVKIKPDSWIFDLQSFYAKAAGGQLPTIYSTNFTEVEQCIKGGYSADITDVLKKRGYDGMLNEKVMDVVTEDGKIYGLPTDAYLLGMACNISMFEKAGLMEADGTPMQPKTWDEVAEFAKKIKDATGEAGLALCSMSNYGGWLITPIMWSYGVKFMEQDADGKWKATFNTPEAEAALSYVKDLKWKYDVLPANTLIDDPEQSKLFAGDKVGMILSLGGNAGNFAAYDMNPDNIGYLAFPAGPARHVTLLGGHIVQIDKNATEAQKDACLRWQELSTNFKATDAYKKSIEDSIASELERGTIVGVNEFSIWSDQAETRQVSEDMIKEKANCNLNHVKLYNDFIANCPADIQAEEPVCAQELYGILDSCIQEVLTNENADCKAILEKANSDFQSNYLDNI